MMPIKPSLEEYEKKIHSLENKIHGIEKHGEDLRVSEQRARLINERTSDLISMSTFAINPVYTYASPSHKNIMGYQPEDLIGKPCFQFIHPDDKKRMLPLLKKYFFKKSKLFLTGNLLDVSESIEYRAKDQSGAWHYLQSTVNLVGKELLFVSKDITKQKLAEKALKASEERYRNILENIEEGYYEVDLRGNFLYFNDSMCRILGYPRHELMGMNNRQYMDTKTAEKVYSVFNAVYRTGNPNIGVDWEFTRKDGTKRHVETSVSLMRDMKGESIGFRGVLRDITARKRAEDQLKRYKDHLEKLVEDRTAELSRSNDQLRFEIKERKAAVDALKGAYKKLKSTQTQLVQSAKLASIGELASGVAHELNQPLTVIRGNTQFMKRNLVEKPSGSRALQEQLELIERNTKRMMNIIGHLRTFSRQTDTTFSPVDLNGIIEDCFLMMGEQLKVRNIRVTKYYHPGLPFIMGDKNQLEQVLLNMITNARDAIEAGREQNNSGEREDIIEITTRESNPHHGWAEVLIRDTGCGISQEHRDKIFDPFFTTKEVGKGTGLGLSISYGIIKDHGGEIQVTETGAAGSTFRVTLPTNQEASAGASKTVTKKNNPRESIP